MKKFNTVSILSLVLTLTACGAEDSGIDNQSITQNVSGNTSGAVAVVSKTDLSLSSFTAKVSDDQTLILGLTSIPSGTSSIKISSISTNGREVGDKVGPNPVYAVATTWPKSVAGFHPGWMIDVQAHALDASGAEIVASQVITLTMTGDPSVTWPATITTAGGTVVAQGTSYSALTFGVQAAINKAQNGDTVIFPAGLYDVKSPIVISKSIMLLGPTNGIARINGSKNIAFDVASNGVTVANLTFNNAEVKFETTSNLIVDNNVFLNYLGLPDAPLAMRGHVSNMVISNNQFGDPINASAQSGFSIYSDGGYQTMVVKNNEVYNACGFHIDAGSPQSGGHQIYVSGVFNSSGMLTEQNYFNGTKSCPMLEFQGATDGATIQDNWAENPQLSSDFHSNDYAIGYSLPLNGSRNVMIQRNVSLETNRFDGTGVRFGFELGGYNVTVQNNYLDGINDAFDDTDGVTPFAISNVKIIDNHVSNVLQTFSSSGAPITQSDNSPTTDVGNVFSRGHPHRNSRY